MKEILKERKKKEDFREETNMEEAQERNIRRMYEAVNELSKLLDGSKSGCLCIIGRFNFKEGYEDPEGPKEMEDGTRKYPDGAEMITVIGTDEDLLKTWETAFIESEDLKLMIDAGYATAKYREMVQKKASPLQQHARDYVFGKLLEKALQGMRHNESGEKTPEA